MKNQLFSLALIVTFSGPALSQKETAKSLFGSLKEDAIVITNNDLIRGGEAVQAFINTFNRDNPKSTYTENFSIQVNYSLEYKIGEVKTGEQVYPVMFIEKKSTSSGSEIELLVMYKKEGSTDETGRLDDRRKEWVRLCNGHDASKLVKSLYTPDAYYYNRGRLLTGTKALSAEYAYMNSPNYKLNLTPKHVVFVTENIAYEIGRCSGSYPLPYMMLWQKQDDGTWMILFDSNF